MISAEVVCDSVSPEGKRITTFKLRYPKFIHGEFMTHRLLSRNASSSRAIPTAKLLEEVRSDTLRAAPVFWGKNQSGMQAAEELSDDVGVYGQTIPASGRFGPLKAAAEFSAKQAARVQWARAAESAADCAERLAKIGAHKQIVNRLLEPFSHINVVATATEWENFFGLRLHHMAQPEMRTLAEEMWKVRQESTPKQLKLDEWHLPFVSDEDDMNPYPDLVGASPPLHDVYYSTAVKVSVARCARVSYESFETGKRSTVEEDLRVYARLNLPGSETYDPNEPIHASPAEHQATPDQPCRAVQMSNEIHTERNKWLGQTTGWINSHQHGNFVGWRQYRKMLKGEGLAPLPAKYR